MRLHTMACWLTRAQPAIFDGVSADDLVSETFLEFLRSPTGLGWIPARASLETFLGAVLKNKYFDHIRRHRHYGGPVEEDLFAVQPPSPVEQREAIDEITQSIRGRRDLEEVVLAITQSNGSPHSNRELAADLGITVSEVVNRKKRIRRSCERSSLQPPTPRKEPKTR
jgi:RNA polymerase sigma factor (sigma-70 family)